MGNESEALEMVECADRLRDATVSSVNRVLRDLGGDARQTRAARTLAATYREVAARHEQIAITLRTAATKLEDS